MDGELLPIALLAKLVTALAVCFAALLAGAWLLKRKWPAFGRVGSPEPGRGGVTVVETKGLGPGSALHLLEVEGTRILVLQTKERSDVLWTRESGDPEFDRADLDAPRAKAPARAAAPRKAAPPDEDDDTLPFLPDDTASLLATEALAIRAAAAKRASERPGRAASAPRPAPKRADRDYKLELQRERQRRYRERMAAEARARTRKAGRRP
jgi:hypothetical protein